MNKELIIACREMMEEKAREVYLKVELQDQEQGKFIQIQLLDNKGSRVYMAYDVGEIIAFINGLQSDYRP